ncbi:Bcr/CflA family drug resistance efflux transporter [Siminovitchia terrae]|uniref:Bcr/CflA family efflux transporter n=1 Tax=Siminovitchia terrae TaxID=1914933 RepID=A0A429X6J9_SIMTE|nr:multidrug effflux MFS transporter [Siminovitchia terrae]RST58930.1 Bcr/CflA family efflux MFS transporter [Siminovitchia terrae]GIN89013.1 Bcr/CflA family drug resistance efflux transporter [Siminovitchia terrae]GIN95082.1 Bcr/CflA family drug resistance efflux transporter [Siminovitchia terrae]
MKKNIGNKTASLLLLIVLVGFPQISETIFSPSLPSIAEAFETSMSDAQLTMSIYFIAFAFGVFFFGRISDKIGRRKAMLYGVFLYFVGNVLCLAANEMVVLLVARFVQAFGASVGSVITQTILRESFSGVERHKLFAQISAALAFTPAIGPLIGGFTDYYFGFQVVFWVLVSMSVIVFFYAFLRLPETAPSSIEMKPLLPIIKGMITNARLWRYGVLIGGINGVLFSYYTEAPFIFTQYFSLTSAMYGFLGIIVALASIAGAMLSKRLVIRITPEKIILRGLTIMLIGTLVSTSVHFLPISLQLPTMIVSVFIILFGTGTALPNCLSLALIDFQDVIGSASAIFSLGYYLLVSIITYGMSVFHNGTVLAMPLYFLMLGLVMLLISSRLQQ